MNTWKWGVLLAVCVAAAGCKKTSAAESSDESKEEDSPKKEKKAKKKKKLPELPEKFDTKLIEAAQDWKESPTDVDEFKGGLKVPGGATTDHKKFGTMTMYTWKYDRPRDEVLVAFLILAKEDGWDVDNYKVLSTGGPRTFALTKDSVSIGVIVGAPKGEEDKIGNILLTPPK
jgi:hypothetical protein